MHKRTSQSQRPSSADSSASLSVRSASRQMMKARSKQRKASTISLHILTSRYWGKGKSVCKEASPSSPALSLQSSESIRSHELPATLPARAIRRLQLKLSPNPSRASTRTWTRTLPSTKKLSSKVFASLCPPLMSSSKRSPSLILTVLTSSSLSSSPRKLRIPSPPSAMDLAKQNSPTLSEPCSTSSWISTAGSDTKPWSFNSSDVGRSSSSWTEVVYYPSKSYGKGIYCIFISLSAKVIVRFFSTPSPNTSNLQNPSQKTTYTVFSIQTRTFF